MTVDTSDTNKPSQPKVATKVVKAAKTTKAPSAPAKAIKTAAPTVAAKTTPAKTATVAKKTTVAKTVPAKTAPAKTTTAARPPTVPIAPAAPVPATVVPVGVVDATGQQIPARSTRPSSRLTQLTVPSMSQTVASGAGKASYTNTMPSTLQVSPAAGSRKKDAALAHNWKTKTVEQLTDAEVLAMPDDEYMNETQMAFFRHKLVTLKKDMHQNAGDTTEHLREDTVVVPDPADRATIEEEHALELRTRDRERKLLKKIEQSIGRIDSGDYGYCDETGEPIGVGRLLARPTATLSLEAQQRRELKQKMFGD